MMFALLCITSLRSFGSDSLTLALNLHQSAQYQKALPIFINLSEKFNSRNDISNYALCQLKIADIIRVYGGINLAIELLTANEKTLTIQLEEPSLLLAQNFITKAEALYSGSRFAEFKQALIKSISIKRQIHLPDKYLAEDYMHLARYYREIPNQNDSCLYWAMKSLRLAKSDRHFSAYLLPRIYNVIGYYFHPPSVGVFRDKNGQIKRDSLNKHFRISRMYYDSAMTSLNNQRVKDQFLLSRIYHNLGNSYNNQIGDNAEIFLPKAISNYRKSLSIIEKYGSPTEMALKYWVIGTAFQRARMSDSAIVTFNKGLMKLMSDFKPTNLEMLPDLQPTISDEWFISLILKKGTLYHQKYRETGNEKDLLTAYEHFFFLLKFNQYMISKSMNERESAYRDHMFSLNAYQGLVEIGFELFQKTGNTKYLYDAYPLLAKSKYAYLNRNDIEASKANVIRLSLLKEEIEVVRRNIRNHIPNFLEEEFRSILPAIPTERIVSPLAQISIASQVLDSFSIKNIQRVLAVDNSVLLDYYSYESKLLTIIVTKDKFDIVQQKVPPDYKARIWKLRKTMVVSTPKEFARDANILYREIMDSVLMHVPSETSGLIICPDNQLQNIPWDALVIDTHNTASFKDLNYVLKHYSIRTVLAPRHLEGKGNERNGFYGVAPGFSNSNRFSALPFSTALVKSKAQQYDGIFATSPTRDSLQMSVFHLASHIVNDSLHPYNSTIYFSDHDSLTIAQLSNSKIQTQLAILNGCQTGSGTYYQSEGTISFARAFYRMGAESVLMTLWSVDDKTTADILELFYSEMDHEESLDMALTHAKTTFIERAATDELANPYYWAGLQLSGRGEPIRKSHYSSMVFLGIGFATLMIFLIYIFRERKGSALVKHL